MSNAQIESTLQALTTAIVNELISLTPETMSEIQFEIVSTADGGADVGLLENHPDASKVALSDDLYRAVSQYLPLIKKYVPGWTRSLIVVKESTEGWNVAVDYER